MVSYDHLSRCIDTAKMIKANVFHQDDGSGPWAMGYLFEGHEINEDSIGMARWYITGNPDGIPPGGESFRRWSERWMEWLNGLQIGHAAVGIVTHNRNIQAVYASEGWRFHYPIYDCEGPAFLSVHVLQDRHIAPWGGKHMPPGLYLIRHGQTSWGT